MATHEQDDKELDQIQQRIDAAKQSSESRSDRVDDLTTRFRELRRKNHFRLMLEEIFHD
jgi:hypothetical protein